MHLSILWQFCGIFVDCPWLSIPPRSQPPVPSWCLSSFAFLQLPDILSLRCSCCRIYPNAIDDLHLYWATLAWDRTSSPNRHAFGRVKSACWQWQSRLLKKCQKALHAVAMLTFLQETRLLALLRGELVLPWTGALATSKAIWDADRPIKRTKW